MTTPQEDLRQATDESLMATLRNGDPSALDELSRRYWKRVVGICIGYHVPRTEAEACANSVLVKVWKNRHSFEVTREFAPWLRIIAERTARDWGRGMWRYRVRVGLFLKDAKDDSSEKNELRDRGVPPDEAFENAEQLARLRAAVARLSEEDREVVTAIVEGLTGKHFAARLGCSRATAYRRKDKVLNKLRELLSETE